MDARTLLFLYQISGRVTDRHLEGISEEQSLVQPDGGANCLNWTLGHLVRARLVVLRILGKTPPLALDLFDVYENSPVTGETKALAWNDLVQHFRLLLKPVDEALQVATPEQLAASSPVSFSGGPEGTVGTLLTMFAYHEAYHGGQIALGRRLVGLPGVIKAPKAGPARNASSR